MRLDRALSIGYFERHMTSTTEWEALCRRCGRCCYEKLELAGVVYYTDIPCEHLDPQTRLCTVYARRDVVRAGCLRLTPALVRRGYLPADCPYCADLPDYRAPQLCRAPADARDF